MFVRCRGGISHNPAEYVSQPDVGLATRALYLFLRAQQQQQVQQAENREHERAEL